MSKIIKTTYRVGRINYKTLKHFILNQKIRSSETIQLNTLDYDDLVLDFREFHKTAMPSDIKILGVKIQEQNYGILRRTAQVTSFVN